MYRKKIVMHHGIHWFPPPLWLLCRDSMSRQAGPTGALEGRHSEQQILLHGRLDRAQSMSQRSPDLRVTPTFIWRQSLHSPPRKSQEMGGGLGTPPG